MNVDLAREKVRDDGWFLLPNGFAERFRVKCIDWLSSAAMRAQIDPTLEAEFEDVVDKYKPVRKLRRLFWNDLEFWSEILELSGVFNLARQLMSGKPALIYHASFLKPKLIGSSVGFHQDQALWSHEYPDAFNLWIALTHSNSLNGCIELFPRSHTLGKLSHTKDPKYRWHPVVSEATPGLRQLVKVPMNAGDIIIWHRYLVHGSGPNLSNEDRLSMVLVFANPSHPGFTAKDVYTLPSGDGRISK
jgi:hypothetical protein